MRSHANEFQTGNSDKMLLLLRNVRVVFFLCVRGYTEPYHDVSHVNTFKPVPNKHAVPSISKSCKDNILLNIVLLKNDI